MQNKTVSFLIKCFFLSFFALACLSIKAQVKVDFDNLPYVENYWTLPVQEIQQRAGAGDPFAQSVMALAYAFGVKDLPFSGSNMGAKISDDWQQKADAGFEQLAEKGNAAAQYRRGIFYTLMKNKDLDKAVDYHTRSAKQGNIRAQYALGRLYGDEKESIYNPELSLHWYKQALPDIEQKAKAGDFYAQDMLFVMNSHGLGGLEKNEQQASYWEEKIIQYRRRHIATRSEHIFSPIYVMTLSGNYNKSFHADDQNDKSKEVLLIKIAVIASILKENASGEMFQSIASKDYEFALSNTTLPKEQFEKKVQQVP